MPSPYLPFIYWSIYRFITNLPFHRAAGYAPGRYTAKHLIDKMRLLIFSLLFVASLISCDSNSPVSANEQKLSDEEFTSLLIDSTFDSELDTTIYYENHTFLEKNYILNDSDEKVFWYKRTGNFKVEESILYKTDCVITGKQSTEMMKGNFQIVFNNVELSIMDGNLQFNRITELKNIEGNSEDIWGTWETIKWTYKYTGESNPGYKGRQKYFYSFNKDSNKVHYGWKNIDMDDPETFEFHSDFKYDKPHLELEGPGEYNISVSFKDDKMYWRYDDIE